MSLAAMGGYQPVAMETSDAEPDADVEDAEAPDFDTELRAFLPDYMVPNHFAVLEAFPLTPSGKIELFSDTIAGFGYDDCLGHPAWLTPAEWLGEAEAGQLHLISNQPKNKLHSQLDHGAVSRADRPKGCERVLMNTDDAADRGLSEGQIVCLSNARGECLAELQVSDGIARGVLQMATGAWYTPQGRRCTKGNPNVLTLDKGTSRLAQGPIAHSCLVAVQPAAREPG